VEFRLFFIQPNTTQQTQLAHSEKFTRFRITLLLALRTDELTYQVKRALIDERTRRSVLMLQTLGSRGWKVGELRHCPI